MVNNETEIIFNNDNKPDSKQNIRPTLFVCQDHTISEYRLQGYQNLGRPVDSILPDIPIYGRFVSRNHGIFQTVGEEVSYTALKTTNGVSYKGEKLEPGTKIILKDGDELVIPAGSAGEGSNSAVLVYACTAGRIRMWRELQEASRDALTGLCGREDFMNWWNKNYGKKDYAEAVLFIMDVDDFKQVNDTKGHNAGDDVLKLVASQLRSVVRYDNQVCRWGGDEFVGVIPGTIEKAASRLKELSIRIEAVSSFENVPITVSIGYVNMNILGNVRDVIGMMELADKALYRVKQAGKGGVVCYEDMISG